MLELKRWNWQVWIESIGQVASDCSTEYWIAVKNAAEWLSNSEYRNSIIFSD